MKHVVVRTMLGITLAGTLCASALHAAEENQKGLPTLLIKGEVVSLNTTDPAATLLTVKDRYGFETPIYVTQETKVSEGDAAFNAANLAAGTKVEVEYNFDVNTAKRHAVSVKVAKAPAPAATAPAAEAAPAAPATAPAATAPSAPAPAPAEPAAAAPATPPAAPAAATAAKPEAAAPAEKAPATKQ